jgi:hypothetical protein
MSMDAADVSYVNSVASVDGYCTFTGTTVIELQHRCRTSGSTHGFGARSDFGVVEVYADVFIERIE